MFKNIKENIKTVAGDVVGTGYGLIHGSVKGILDTYFGPGRFMRYGPARELEGLTDYLNENKENRFKAAFAQSGSAISDKVELGVAALGHIQNLYYLTKTANFIKETGGVDGILTDPNMMDNIAGVVDFQTAIPAAVYFFTNVGSTLFFRKGWGK